MIANKQLNTIIVVMCLIAACDANYYSDFWSNHYNEYTNKLSSYMRTVGEFVYPDTPNSNKQQEKRFPLAADDNQYKQMSSDNDPNPETNTESCFTELRKCWSIKNDIPDDIMSRRIVNMLLSRAKVRDEGSIQRRYIVIETSDLELQTLTKFGLGELKNRAIDPILSDAIKTPESYGFTDFVFMVYTFITRLVNYVIDQKYTVISIIVISYLINTFITIRWNFWNILFSSIHILLSISFLISWWKLLENDQIRETMSQDSNIPIQCQPDKMRWMDKAMTFFYHYDCDKHYEKKVKNFLHEDTPKNGLTDDLTHSLLEMFIFSGQFLRGIPDFGTNRLPGILLQSIIMSILVFLTACFCVFLTYLYRFIREPRKMYSTLKNNFCFLVKNLQNQLNMMETAIMKKMNYPMKRNDINGFNKNRIADNNAYYKISCGTETSLIIKTDAAAKNLEKNELETKINSILGKKMEVERILGKIATKEKEQITVSMKRKEDKDELIERSREMKENGLFVEENEILLDEIAKWNLLGLSNDERLENEVREICVNGELWIWNEKSRKWVQKNST